MNQTYLGCKQNENGFPCFFLKFCKISYITFVIVIGVGLSACSENKSSLDIDPSELVSLPESEMVPNGLGEQVCEPQCLGRECGSDLCGGLCGSCVIGDVCATGGNCVPEEAACTDTCESLGYQCGEVCGESCGSCSGSQESCSAGQCQCQPACAGRVCGDADGCGDFCTPCPVDTNCVDCVFKLAVAQKTFADGVLTHVTLALTFSPSGNTALPVMADLQLKVTGPATIERLGLGQALLDAEKEPLIHPHTGATYQRLDAETYRVILLSTQNTNVIEGGHWLSIRFAVGDTEMDGPATFQLKSHGQILAPSSANVLDYSEIDNQVVVWPEVSNAE